jgi:hypothetical protein
MSRAYRITVKESLTRTIEVEDGVCSSLELLPILQPERMRELLARELGVRGFKREGQTATRDEGGGVTISIELATGEVSVTAEGHARLELSAERTAVVDAVDDPGHQQSLRAAARQSLERAATAEEEALRRKVTEELGGRLRDVKGELDGVVNRVTVEALKQRAGELGQVEEIHEEPNGNLTIKVRV